jgi:hypothetical protein
MCSKGKEREREKLNLKGLKTTLYYFHENKTHMG